MSYYRLISLEKSRKFDDTAADNWYCYIIANDYNRITGYRSGSLEQVKQHTSQVINRLNRETGFVTTPPRLHSYKACELSSLY